MKLLKRILQIVVIFIVLLVVVGGVGGYWFITKSQPQIDGTLKVAGLKSKVEVVRDPLGVPHIYASTVDDLFFAQGYVQAQDRLWQMDFNRRVGQGTLSEMFGASTFESDRFLRTLGLGRAARANLATLTAEELAPLDAYARGVNAFIDTHLDNLPLEYTLLGVKPTHWQPVDTLGWAEVMAMNLANNYEAELFRASLIEKVGADKAKALMPPYPATGPFVIPPDVKSYQGNLAPVDSPMQAVSIGQPDLSEIAQIMASLKLGGEDVGSNEWVVDGTKSTTGKPILSNDQHLAIQMPSIWYEVGLHCVPQNDACPYNVAGVTFPGAPGVVEGHNDRIAWSTTNSYPDVQDLYIEEINPQNPNQYKFNSQWEDMQIVEEPIKVKDVVSETLKVQITRHGPIMTPVLGSGVTKPLALQWTALRDRSHLFSAVLQLDRAKNWDDFRTALKSWDVISQHLVYADVDGNIGYQLTSHTPIRAKGDGTVPVPGTGEYEWTGYIPFDEMPFVYNPSSHYIAAPNNATVPSTYKYFIGTDWAAPYRAMRITDWLKAKDKFSIDDMKAIQGDVYSIPLAQFQKYVVALKPEGFLQQRAMDQVRTWDGRLTTDNVGGTIVELAYERLLKNLFADQLGADLFKTYQGAGDYHRRVVLALLDDPKSDWWGSAGRDAMLQKSFAEGVDWLGSQYGDAPGDWHWGRLHTATFEHPLGSVKPLDLLFNAGPVAVPGGVNTVFATSFKIGVSYGAGSSASQRQIIDFSNLSNSVAIHTTGQSGQPLSKHFSDMVLMWRDVQYAPFYFDRATLDKVKEGTLVLTP